MRTLRVFAIVACAAGWGCASHQWIAPLIDAPQSTLGTAPTSPLSGTSKYRLLYAFGAAPDDAAEPTSITAVGNALYGTAYSGGGAGMGAVFSITSRGDETILHRFAGADGAQPAGAPIAIDNVLYGTAYYGGARNVGVVYALTLSGQYQILHSFIGGKHDGAAPYGGLVELSGTLYGTTASGGRYGRGTVYSITTGGIERILHSFSVANGSTPSSTLAVIDGNLYGTTPLGGIYGLGTIFRTAPNGATTVLHSFGSAGDGARPIGSLVTFGGTIFGTTPYGGAHGVGTAFAMAMNGAERVIYSFDGTSTGGCYPLAGLTAFGPRLYGTSDGKLNGAGCGNGTVFAITPGGDETTLHVFSGRHDGVEPSAALAVLKTKLYGVTLAGGKHDQGVVYSVKP